MKRLVLTTVAAVFSVALAAPVWAQTPGEERHEEHVEHHEAEVEKHDARKDHRAEEKAKHEARKDHREDEKARHEERKDHREERHEEEHQ